MKAAGLSKEQQHIGSCRERTCAPLQGHDAPGWRPSRSVSSAYSILGLHKCVLATPRRTPDTRGGLYAPGLNAPWLPGLKEPGLPRVLGSDVSPLHIRDWPSRWWLRAGNID